MKLNIDISLNNDAFSEYPAHEVARILVRLAESLSDTEVGATSSDLLRALYDINGNCVGACDLLK